MGARCNRPYYRPQTKFGARYYFCTCLSFRSQGGVPGQVRPPGQVPPWQVHPPSMYPPPGQVPPRQVHPPGRYTPTPGNCSPPGRYTSPPHPMVSARPVRILLECILVDIAVNDIGAKKSACSMLVLVLTKLVVNGTLCICFINHIDYNIETHNSLAVLLRN